MHEAAGRDELPRRVRRGASDLGVARALVEHAEAAVADDVAEVAVEEAVRAAAVARLRRRLREQHAVERARRVAELELRPREVLLDDLLAGERGAGRAGGVAVRAVLAHADAVAEAAAVED